MLNSNPKKLKSFLKENILFINSALHHLQTNDLIVVFNIIIINILEYVLLDEKENFDVG